MDRAGRVIALACGLVVLAGCGSRGGGTSVYLPPPSGAPAVQSEYRIGPFDVLDVKVFQVEELSGPSQVDGLGRLSLPLIGPMDVMDATPVELAGRIEDAYRARYLVDPVVQVQVTEMNSRRLTVNGAVNAPGNFPVVGTMSLLQAIATAKGLNASADRSNVVIVRTIGGQKMAARFDLSEIEGGRLEDPIVYPADVIVVDTDEVRQFLRDFAPVGAFASIFNAF